ncbi:MAG: hypothetical protein R2867_34960 [Caldilineaceae bacterium]
MVSMHAASFARGEEVLLFLQRQGVTWQMVDGAAGKFLIQDKEIINRDWAVAMPVDGFLAAVTRQSTDRKTVSAFATLAQQLAPPTQPTPLPIYFATSSSMGTVHKWLTPHASATYLINLNSSQLANSSDHDADSIGLRNAIIAAASQWSAVATADFSLRYGGETAATATGYNGANEILFMHKGIGSGRPPPRSGIGRTAQLLRQISGSMTTIEGIQREPRRQERSTFRAPYFTNLGTG